MNRKVAAITGDGKFTVIEEQIPELKKGQVLVEVKASLISPGTELMGIPALRKEPKADMKPRKFGYSNAGVILKQGEGCEDLPKGMRVACMGGNYALHSNYACIPRNLLIPIPDGMSFETASFAHLAATSLHGLRRADLQIGEYLAVSGLGLVGNIALQIAAASNVHVIGLDRLKKRLELAKKGKADGLVDLSDKKDEDVIREVKEFTRGYGLDSALMCFGGNMSSALELTAKMMKVAPDTHKMGRIVIVGVANFSLTNWPVSFGNIDLRSSSRPGAGYHDDAYEHGRDYPSVFVQWTNKRNMEEALLMHQSGRINLDMLITHRIPLSKFAEGAEILVSNPNDALGVIINY